MKYFLYLTKSFYNNIDNLALNNFTAISWENVINQN